MGLVYGPGKTVVVQFGDERLPKGPRFASESLDADTGSGAVFQTAPLPKKHFSYTDISEEGCFRNHRPFHHCGDPSGWAQQDAVHETEVLFL